MASGADAATTRKTAPEPAATLLLPYFEQDVGSRNGVTTQFSVNNASDQAVLAHITVWSDLSVVVLDFNIYLTGYDVQTISLRDLLSGILPRTASAGQDPADTISPQGAFSQDIDFASCNGLLPPPAVLPASFVAHLQQSLTGRPDALFSGLCFGRALGDNIARGYITIDTVSNCTFRNPSVSGYFAAGGTGDATNQNVLWGDYFYSNPATGAAEGNTLVHIVADANDPETSTSGQYTFYGRYVGWSAVDNRRPLGTNFAVRYLNGGPSVNTTSLIVWRDSKKIQAPFTCPVVDGTRPSWYRLGQEKIFIFDEQEQPAVPPSLNVSPQPAGAFSPFPAETQRVAVGGTDFPVPFNSGWLLLNLNTFVTPAGFVPPFDPTAAQAWVAVKMDSGGRFSVGYDAIQLDNADHPIH